MKRGESIRLAGAIFIAVALFLRMPCLSYAGNLEPPSGPTEPTMKTLDQIPPTWDQKLPCDSTTNCPRFEIVMDGAGVLDKETGLVWEQSPSTTIRNWLTAQDYCNSLSKGGRFGWRLPTLQELASLMDPTQISGLCLPSGNTFAGVQEVYWSATTYAGDTNRALGVNFAFNALIGGCLRDVFNVGSPKTFLGPAWCVRGGQGVDPQ